VLFVSFLMFLRQFPSKHGHLRTWAFEYSP
jgi:hypothetical protein